jgi:hypothetical protein
MDKVIVNPTFRSDIDGKLFKNKDTNKDIQETVIFNALTTRLSIYKGDLALFPNLGLKQHLFNFSFEDESGVAEAASNMEADIEQQLNRSCTVQYELNSDTKTIKLSIHIEGIEYAYEYEFTNINNSIRIINNTITN